METALNKAPEPVIRKKHSRDLGPLHALLLKACPPDESGVKSIYVLAERLGIRAYSIYKWCDRNSIPPKRAQEIVELADGRVTIGQFSPYIFF